MAEEDAYESAVRKLVREKNGGAVTADLFWNIVEALDRDLGRSDKRSRERHAETIGLISAHIKDDEEARRLVANDLKEWQLNQAKRCAEEHRKLFGRKPRRRDDPDDVDFGRGYETRDEADSARKLFSRETLVANFWILVGLLVLSGIVNRIVDMLFNS